VNHVAYPHSAGVCARFGISGLAILTLAAGLGCTAGVKASGPGSGGTVGTTGAAGTTGKAGTSGTGRAGVSGSDVGVAGTMGTVNPDAASCQTVNYAFTPTVPTVFILVDRSGSEFDSGCPNVMTGPYFTLRTAVETVVTQLQANVRFGLGVFVGDHTTGACALDWDTVPIALNNSSAINLKYNSLGQVAMASEGNCKADTPAVEAVPMVKSILQGDTTVTGPKYVLLATDGQTDFCDDGDPDCPADALTYQIQDLYAAGFGTLVLGLPTAEGGGTAFNTSVLQNLANAGMGQGTALPTQNGTTTPSQLYYACSGQGTAAGTDSWTNLYTAAGHTAAQLTSIATYTTAGTAPVYAPTTTSTADLATQLSAAINSIPRSCTFDLPANITVNANKLNEAVIYLVDSTSSEDVIPLDTNSANGWNLTGPSEVQLFGSWCDKLRDQGTTDIKFGFPCDIIICIDNCITN
jgi:hypothetical protein